MCKRLGNLLEFQIDRDPEKNSALFTTALLIRTQQSVALESLEGPDGDAIEHEIKTMMAENIAHKMRELLEIDGEKADLVADIPFLELYRLVMDYRWKKEA